MACSVQNMYLMATSLGVAGYWSSWDSGARECAEMRVRVVAQSLLALWAVLCLYIMTAYLMYDVHHVCPLSDLLPVVLFLIVPYIEQPNANVRSCNSHSHAYF